MSSQQNPNKDPTTDGLILIALFIGVYFLLQFLLFEDLKYQRLTLYKYYITAYKFVLDFIYVPQFIENLYDQLTIYEPKEISKELFDSIKYRMFLLVDLPILALLAFIFIKGGSKVKKFNNIYTLKSFINAQKELWQWLYPIADLDMKNGKFDLDINIEDGEWAMAKRPLHFCKIYGLLNENHSVIESNASIVYANQVGRLYTSFEDLKDYEQALMCIFAAQATKKEKGKEDAIKWLMLLSKTYKNPDYSWVSNAWMKYKDTPAVQTALSEHGYVYTVLARLLELARGILPTSRFIWLKPKDRELYFLLNRLGGRECFTECAGSMNHFMAEKCLGRPILRQYTLGAVRGLNECINGTHGFKITKRNYGDL